MIFIFVFLYPFIILLLRWHNSEELEQLELEEIPELRVRKDIEGPSQQLMCVLMGKKQ